MDKILSARLVWIYSLEEYKKRNEDSQPKISDNKFISLINKGDADEFDSSYYNQIQRHELLSDKINVDGCELSISFVLTNYNKYQHSFINIVLNIETDKGVGIEDFARLIYGNSILDHELIKSKKSIGTALIDKQLITNSRPFIINQIRKTIPSLPHKKPIDTIK